MGDRSLFGSLILRGANVSALEVGTETLTREGKQGVEKAIYGRISRVEQDRAGPVDAREGGHGWCSGPLCRRRQRQRGGLRRRGEGEEVRGESESREKIGFQSKKNPIKCAISRNPERESGDQQLGPSKPNRREKQVGDKRAAKEEGGRNKGLRK